MNEFEIMNQFQMRWENNYWTKTKIKIVKVKINKKLNE